MAAVAAGELVAEIGAALQCAKLGVTQDVRPDRAQYVANWVGIAQGRSQGELHARRLRQLGCSWRSSKHSGMQHADSRVVPALMESRNDPSSLFLRASFGNTAAHFSRKHSSGVTSQGRNVGKLGGIRHVDPGGCEAWSCSEFLPNTSANSVARGEPSGRLCTEWSCQQLGETCLLL
jgi:Zincin-like metallopeptidase